MSHSSASTVPSFSLPASAPAFASRRGSRDTGGAHAEPSAWVARWLAHLPGGARVIDLAAGRGRHVRLAHALGLQVLAVDRDAEALKEALATTAGQGLVLDLEAGPWALPSAAFDAVVVTNYLFRARFALMCGLLAPGGVLIYETFGAGNEAFGRPANAAFLLEEGELLARAQSAGLVVLAYESGYTKRPKPAIVQRICAARPPVDGKCFALG